MRGARVNRIAFDVFMEVGLPAPHVSQVMLISMLRSDCYKQPCVLGVFDGP